MKLILTKLFVGLPMQPLRPQFVLQASISHPLLSATTLPWPVSAQTTSLFSPELSRIEGTEPHESGIT